MTESNTNNTVNENAPSKEEQQAILNEIQHRHMIELVRAPGLVKRVEAEIKSFAPEYKIEGDVKLIAAKQMSERRLQDGTCEEFERLGVGVNDQSSTGYAWVAERVNTVNGVEVRIENDFTAEDASLVASCVDELAMAKFSGQIPDLDINFETIYIPLPHED